MSAGDFASVPMGPDRSRTLLWASGAAAALAVHAGAVAWALRQRPILPTDAMAPVAVMVDLAPAPVAPEAPEEQVAPDNADAPEVEADAPELALAPAPPDLPPPPVEMPDVPIEEAPPPSPADMPLAEILPRMEQPPDLPAAVVDPRPVARPPELRVARPEPEPEEEAKPPAPSRAALRAQTQAPTAERVAAPTNSSGASGAVSPAKWQSRLMAHLERRKRYPSGARQRREEGTAHVRFSIDGSGNVRSVQLVRSSGYPELDEAVVALVRRSSPVPAPPPGAPHDITAPVRFNIR